MCLITLNTTEFHLGGAVSGSRFCVCWLPVMVHRDAWLNWGTIKVSGRVRNKCFPCCCTLFHPLSKITTIANCHIVNISSVRTFARTRTRWWGIPPRSPTFLSGCSCWVDWWSTESWSCLSALRCTGPHWCSPPATARPPNQEGPNHMLGTGHFTEPLTHLNHKDVQVEPLCAEFLADLVALQRSVLVGPPL